LLKTRWTNEDIERLKAMIASGASVVRVAAAFDRTIPIIRSQARKLGMPFPSIHAARKKYAPSGTWRHY
jgi:GcrA cell cycle regulator